MNQAAVDIRPTIVPKSDRLNADDLIGQTRTITITGAKLSGEADQPVALSFEGDGGKPWYPCKSMRRVLVQVWGPDGRAYAGRSLTIYRDDKVQFGGLAVGGIRISHMSHIDTDITMALTATRANRKPFTVRPLRQAPAAQQRPAEPAADGGFPGDRTTSSTRIAPSANNGGADGGGSPLTLEQRTAAFLKRVAEATTTTKLTAVGNAAQALRTELERSDPEGLAEAMAIFDAKFDQLEEAERQARSGGGE